MGQKKSQNDEFLPKQVTLEPVLRGAPGLAFKYAKNSYQWQRSSLFWCSVSDEGQWYLVFHFFLVDDLNGYVGRPGGPFVDWLRPKRLLIFHQSYKKLFFFPPLTLQGKQVFVYGVSFQPSPIFANKARAYRVVATLRCSTLRTVRWQGWKSYPV